MVMLWSKDLTTAYCFSGQGLSSAGSVQPGGKGLTEAIAEGYSDLKNRLKAQGKRFKVKG
jgi:hypothetical protein